MTSFDCMAAIGDSITAGYSATRPEYCWVARLGALLSAFQDRPIEVVNLGISGNLLSPRSRAYRHPDAGRPSGLERCRRDMIAHSPDLAAIAYGLNDMRCGTPLDVFMKDLERMVRKIQDASGATVVLVGISFMTAFSGYGDVWGHGDVDTARRWNRRLKQYADGHDLIFADVFESQGQSSWTVSADGVHPNNLGHALIAHKVFVDCILLQPRWKSVAAWSPRPPYEFVIPAGVRPRADVSGNWIVTQEEASMRMPAGGFFFDGAWLSNWSGLEEDDAIEVFAREAERIYKETDYATNFTGYGYGLGFGAFFGDFHRLVQMLDDPATVKEEHRAQCKAMIARAGKILDRMGPYIQLLTIGDDMGAQNGPMCRPSVVEQCVAPYLKEFCDFVHRNSDVRIFMHNCGSIKPLIPILLDCGVDVLNPVQVSADDMDPRDLKREFGDRVVFWGGGCDTQNVLGRATPQEVARHVEELVGIFKPGGGFVFNQVHNIMGDVPPENIVAMLDAAYEAGFH